MEEALGTLEMAKNLAAATLHLEVSGMYVDIQCTCLFQLVASLLPRSRLSHFLPDLLPVGMLLTEEEGARHPAHDSGEVVVTLREADVGAPCDGEGEDLQHVGDEGNVGGGEGEEVVVGVEEGHGVVGGHGGEAVAHSRVQGGLGVGRFGVLGAGVAVGVRDAVGVDGVGPGGRQGAPDRVREPGRGGRGLRWAGGEAGIYCLLADGLLAKASEGHRLGGYLGEWG